jgi:hypothetical protein
MCTKSLQVCRRFTTQVAFVAILALTWCQVGWAQGPGSYGASTLLYSPSAVANGLGGGLVAASTEASAIYYNPAALSRLGRVALEMNTFKLFPLLENDGGRYYHAAGAFRTSSESNLWLGAAYTRTGFGKQVITGEDSPEPLGTFEPYEAAFSLAAATKMGQRSRLGIGFKFVRVNYAPRLSGLKDYSANAFAVDVGFLYDGFLQAAHISKQFLNQPLPWQNWANAGLPPGFSFGVALAHVGTKLDFPEAAQGDPLPQNLRVGLAWNLIESDVLGLVVAGEFTKILVKQNRRGQADGALKAIFSAWSDQSIRDEFSEAIYTGGLEASLLQVAAIRIGRYWSGIMNFGYNTFGYSIGPPGLRFSFARFAPFESLFIDEWHIYTVSVGMSKLPF